MDEMDTGPESERSSRRMLVVLAVVVVVGLLAFVRGRDHHRGDDEGALASTAPATNGGDDTPS